MTYIMSCVWLDYMVKYFQCKNCVGSSPKTKKCVASFLVPGDKKPIAQAIGLFVYPESSTRGPPLAAPLLPDAYASGFFNAKCAILSLLFPSFSC